MRGSPSVNAGNGADGSGLFCADYVHDWFGLKRGKSLNGAERCGLTRIAGWGDAVRFEEKKAETGSTHGLNPHQLCGTRPTE
jgi:hypothetical protein